MPVESRQDDENNKTGRKATPAQRQAGINNLKAYNASRSGSRQPNLRHGVKSFIATGSAPSDIEQRLDQLEEGLLKDIGRAPSTAEICLIQSIRTALGVCLLCDRFLHQGGLSNFRKNRWVLSVAASYANSLRLNLRELGIDWSGKQTTNLAEELSDKRKRNSLESVIAATEEPATLPEWAKKHYEPSADCDSPIEGLPVNKTESVSRLADAQSVGSSLD